MQSSLIDFICNAYLSSSYAYLPSSDAYLPSSDAYLPSLGPHSVLTFFTPSYQQLIGKMESFKMTLTSFLTDQDHHALEKLELAHLLPVDLPSFLHLNPAAINEAYEEMAVIRMAALLTKRASIVSLTDYLLPLMSFLQKDAFNQDVKYSFDNHDILVWMRQQVQDLHSFGLKVGEPSDGRFCKNLLWFVQKIESATTGDYARAQRELGLHKLPSLNLRSTKKVPSYSSLFANYGSAMEVANAALYTKDSCLLKVSTTLASLSLALRSRYYEMEGDFSVHIDPEDVAEFLSNEVDEWERWVEGMEGERMVEVKRVADRGLDTE